LQPAADSEEGHLVPARRDPKLTHKTASQVALIGKAGAKSGLGNGVAIPQQALRPTHAKLHQVGMRSNPGLPGECPQELEAAYSGKRGEFVQRDRLVGLRVQTFQGSGDERRRFTGYRPLGSILSQKVGKAAEETFFTEQLVWCGSRDRGK
jgi:hypothetical protein